MFSVTAAGAAIAEMFMPPPSPVPPSSAAAVPEPLLSVSMRAHLPPKEIFPGVNYIAAHISRLGDPEHRPLAIAENKISWDVSSTAAK